MAKAAAKRQKWKSSKVRTLYLGQWMAALRVKAVDIAKGIGCSEAYLSNLIKGDIKKNPSAEFMLDLSDFLDVGVNELFEPPPGSGRDRANRQALQTPVERVSGGPGYEDPEKIAGRASGARWAILGLSREH